MEKCILIISPLVSTTYLSAVFKEKRINIIAFFDNKVNLPEYYKPALNKENFYRTIYSTNNLEQDIQLIQDACAGQELLHGFIESESSVEYGEKLLRKLFPNSSNDPYTSVNRYKKFEMNEQLFRKQLPAVKQIKVINNDITPSVIAFLNEIKYPIVVKPNYGSAGSVNVFFLDSKENTLNYLKGKNNEALLFECKETLVQEMLLGEEYFVDAVSFNGEHTISGVFKYTKERSQQQFMYSYVDLIKMDSDIGKEAIAYTLNVLDALDFKYGLSHTEIMKTTSSFKLIELNPRISGGHGIINRMAKLKYGSDQLEIYLANIFRTIITNKQNNNNYRAFFLKNCGFTYKKINKSIIEEINGVLQVLILKETCGEVPKTTSLIDTIAIILIANEDVSFLEKTTEELNKIEKEGKYIAC